MDNRNYWSITIQKLIDKMTFEQSLEVIEFNIDEEKFIKSDPKADIKNNYYDFYIFLKCIRILNKEVEEGHLRNIIQAFLNNLPEEDLKYWYASDEEADLREYQKRRFLNYVYSRS